jgi:ABC-2 type transport system ATP-binding protein
MATHPTSGQADETVLRITALTKIYSAGIFHRTSAELNEQDKPRFSLRPSELRRWVHRRVAAVDALSLDVRRGEVFGFIGPNGAGKSTTIRILMGLLYPTRGSAELLGSPVGDLAARSRIGFLPESPYFYDYLTAEELLDFVGRIFGLDHTSRRQRSEQLLEQVGLAQATRRPLRKFSKGMLQRIGLAQALMGDPELVVLDEPMSGLDPLGRRQVRDLIVELRKAGKTIFFSTHILSDVEALCDRAAIVIGGQLRSVGPLDLLVSSRILSTDVTLRGPVAVDAVVRQATSSLHRTGELMVATLAPEVELEPFIAAVHAAGARLVSVAPKRESLEDLFVRAATGDDASQRA